ncbi:hypothetical protein V1509DRAFT_515691 [Lipomyces kononenkoae]
MMDLGSTPTITSSLRCLASAKAVGRVQADAGEVHNIATRLPYECLLQVFSYLELDHLGICAQVCRSWNLTASDYNLWHDLELSDVLPRRLRGSTKTSFLHSQLQKCSRKVVVQNPYYLSDSDITTLMLTLGHVTVCGQQYSLENDVSQESPLETLNIENYSRLDCCALSRSLSNDALTYNIHTLSFHGTHISSSVVAAICNSHTLRAKLTNLDLAFSSLESHAVYMIADSLENLDRLSLSGNLAVCGAAVEYLLLRLGHVITDLDLRFIWGLEAAWLVGYLTTSTRGVKVLDIRGCEHFSKRNIRDMLAVSPNTKILNSVVLEDESVEGYRQFVQLLASASVVGHTGDLQPSSAIKIHRPRKSEQIGTMIKTVFGSYESSSSSASAASEDAEDDFGILY